MAPELEAMLDPTGRMVGEERTELAARPNDLRGSALGLLNNTKPNSGVLLEQVGALLQERYGVASLTVFSKSSFAIPADEVLLARIAEQCDFAIAGVGD